MKSFFALSTFFVIITVSCIAQSTCTFLITDAKQVPLPDVIVITTNSDISGISDSNGLIELNNIGEGMLGFTFSMLGFDTVYLQLIFPAAFSESHHIVMRESEYALEGVVVSSTRTNSRIEDEPTKIEVLGTEELDDESALVPGNISSLLGDISIITIQRTDLLKGSEVVRMQGLDSRFTQIIRDGMPVFDGFSGSFGILDIPPLDLKQVEIISGSNSTLYGNGAVAGLINFISKTPSDSLAFSTVLNFASSKAFNFSSFTSSKYDYIGFTLFTGLNSSEPYSYNSRGYTVVPDEQEFILHPRLFLYPGENMDITLGMNLNFDDLHAGELDELHLSSNSNNIEIETNHQTYDMQFHYRPLKNNEFSVKAATSHFYQFNNSVYEISQYNNFLEISDKHIAGKHTIVGGVDVRNQSRPDNVVRSYSAIHTSGVFILDDWQIIPKLLIEPSIRIDKCREFDSSFIILPRLALFYKPVNNLSIRLAYGSGYNIPDPLEFDDPSWLLEETPDNTLVERSMGYNADINYRFFTHNNVGININQAFFYTKIEHPLRLQFDTAGVYRTIVNDADPLETYGSDTYLRIDWPNVELYLGYNHTFAHQQTDTANWYLPFNPQDKISAAITFTIWKNLSGGIEASGFGNQYIYDNKPVDNYVMCAGMITYKYSKIRLTLNCENLLGYAIQNRNILVAKPYNDENIFLPVWGPVERRTLNFSCKFDL